MHFLSKSLLILSLAVISNFASSQTLTVSAPWELKAENPTVGGYAFTRMGVVQTLIAIDKSAQLAPQLATEWSVNEDKTQWTLTLRDGVKFTDGEAFNADVAAKSLNVARAQPGPLKKAPVKSIAAKGNTVIITLEKPYSVLPAVLAHYTTMVLSPKSYDKDGKVTQVIGTGPFKIARFEPPQRMDVIKNENYWGKKASISKAEYVAVSRGETRALMAESKPAIMAYSLDPASIKRLERNPKLNVMSIMLPRVITIKVNNAHPFMKDVNVRQAISHAIDRNGIAAALMRAPEIKTTQLFPPSLTQWHNKKLKPFAYEPSNAKRLLKDAGFAFNAEGYATKNGKPFEVTLRTYADRPELPLIANALQDQFKKIGIKMNVSVGSYTEIPSGHQDGTLELALMSRNYATVQSPLNNISGDFGRGGADWGAMNWKNETVAKALDELALDNADANADKNRAIVTKAIQEELPVIPVTWYKQSVVVSKALNGVSLDPFDSTYRLEDITLSK